MLEGLTAHRVSEIFGVRQFMAYQFNPCQMVTGQAFQIMRCQDHGPFTHRLPLEIAILISYLADGPLLFKKVLNDPDPLGPVIIFSHGLV